MLEKDASVGMLIDSGTPELKPGLEVIRPINLAELKKVFKEFNKFAAFENHSERISAFEYVDTTPDGKAKLSSDQMLGKIMAYLETLETPEKEELLSFVIPEKTAEFLNVLETITREFYKQPEAADIEKPKTNTAPDLATVPDSAPATPDSATDPASAVAVGSVVADQEQDRLTTVENALVTPSALPDYLLAHLPAQFQTAGSAREKAIKKFQLLLDQLMELNEIIKTTKTDSIRKSIKASRKLLLEQILASYTQKKDSEGRIQLTGAISRYERGGVEIASAPHRTPAPESLVLVSSPSLPQPEIVPAQTGVSAFQLAKDELKKSLKVKPESQRLPELSKAEIVEGLNKAIKAEMNLILAELLPLQQEILRFLPSNNQALKLVVTKFFRSLIDPNSFHFVSNRQRVYSDALIADYNRVKKQTVASILGSDNNAQTRRHNLNQVFEELYQAGRDRLPRYFELQQLASDARFTTDILSTGEVFEHLKALETVLPNIDGLEKAGQDWLVRLQASTDNPATPQSDLDFRQFELYRDQLLTTNRLLAGRGALLAAHIEPFEVLARMEVNLGSIPEAVRQLLNGIEEMLPKISSFSEPIES